MNLKTDFKDDIFQGNRKYLQIKNEDGTVSFQDVTTYEQEGDYFGAAELNQITGEVNKKAGAILQAAGGASNVIILNDVQLVDGFSITFIVANNNLAGATSINGKPLYKPGTTTAPNLVAGKAVTVWYNAAKGCFFIKASGEGTAQVGDVLAGKTFTNDNDIYTGTMPNNGAVSHSLPINGGYTIPAGYHNGSGKVTQSITTKVAQTYTPGTADQSIAAGQYLSGAQTIKGDANLIPANILSGKSIFGVAGSVIAGKKFASGTTVSSNTVDLFKTSSGDASKGFIRMSSLNLTFVPRIIYYYDTSEPDYYANIYVRDGVGGSVGGIKFVVTSITCRSYSASNPHEYLYVPSGFNKNYTWFAWK